MLPEWTVATNYELGIIQERTAVDIALPLASTTGITTSIISGALPAGLRLEENTIIGRPFEVKTDKLSNFVIRASSINGVLDRTFSVIIQGADDPLWITPAGDLGVGPNNVFFILDSSIIDYQLLATDPDLPAGDTLSYFVADGSGELPPGIELTLSGKLIGVVDPLLALDRNIINGGYDVPVYGSVPFDYAVLSDNGLDSYFYDTTLYDYSVPTQNPKKLNRRYEFEVTVTDGDNFVKRRFQIYVVGDDFARADTTIMKAADGVFTADMTYARKPLWLTPSNLGVKRADNYITVYLDTLENSNITGQLFYFLEAYNNDGTPSILPTGMAIDQTTGEIAGRVSYQPAVTREYKFTVSAQRFNEGAGIVTVFGSYSYDVLSGNNTIRIGKLSETLTDGLNDLQNLVTKEIVIEGVGYTVESVNSNNSEYDTITLAVPLLPTYIAVPLVVSRPASGTDYFFVESLLNNDNNFYTGKSLNFSDSESYQLEDIYPYIEWKITADTTLEFNTNILNGNTLEQYLSTDTHPAYITNVSGTEILLLVPAISRNRITNDIKDLFHTADSSEVVINSGATVDRVKIDNVLTRVFSTGRELSFATYTKGFFSKAFSRNEVEVSSSNKTFTLRLLGEVDSTIAWETDADLGVLSANRISTISVNASTTIPGGFLKYALVGGKLPPGIILKGDGELVGKVPINGTPGNPGLTFFDTGQTTFDGSTTTQDRVYTFTVIARDRFGFSATSREFTLTINDLDNLTYSNIFVRPFLNQEQEESFTSLINNSTLIDPTSVYRPSDTNFGVQRDLKSLIYGGIETSSIDTFVSAIAKNHKRKKFLLGDLKTAIAKRPGTNEVVYEVVYIDLIDPAQPLTGNTRTYFNINNGANKITSDASRYNVADSSPVVPRKYRPTPVANTITADSDAIQISQSRDVKRYIANIDNMRENIKSTGTSSRDFLPLWMRTAQSNSLVELDYVLAIPLVYCKPGTSAIIQQNILNTGFNFTSINYDIDRYIIDTTTGISREQYILFANYQFNV
jgi:hypothetical protein